MLDIGIGTRASRVPHSDQPSLSLDDDGYYWCIEPLFKQLAVQTGQYIDLYGHSHFEGADLTALQETLDQENTRHTEHQDFCGRYRD